MRSIRLRSVRENQFSRPSACTMILNITIIIIIITVDFINILRAITCTRNVYTVHTQTPDGRAVSFRRRRERRLDVSHITNGLCARTCSDSRVGRAALIFPARACSFTRPRGRRTGSLAAGAADGTAAAADRAAARSGCFSVVALTSRPVARERARFALLLGRKKLKKIETANQI